jgi:hypothetical protein
VVDGAVRVARDLGRPAVLGVDENAASSVAHPAVAFDDTVVSVNFHFFFNIGVAKLSHFFGSPWKSKLSGKI